MEETKRGFRDLQAGEGKGAEEQQEDVEIFRHVSGGRTMQWSSGWWRCLLVLMSALVSLNLGVPGHEHFMFGLLSKELV
jgi:hypothetical protein